MKKGDLIPIKYGFGLHEAEILEIGDKIIIYRIAFSDTYRISLIAKIFGLYMEVAEEVDTFEKRKL